jgi:hypothetical protein
MKGGILGSVGNETVTMLILARILGLVLMRLGSIRATTLQYGAVMVSTTAVVHTITHMTKVADIPVTVNLRS